MEYFVAFTDESKETILASFGCVQDEDVWPNQGVVTDDDPRWKTYSESFPPETFATYVPQI